MAHRATRWSIRGWQLRCSKASNAKALHCIGCIASLTSALYKAKRRGNIQRQQDSTSKHFVTWEFVRHLDSQVMSRHVTSCHVMSRHVSSHHVSSCLQCSKVVLCMHPCRFHKLLFGLADMHADSYQFACSLVYFGSFNYMNLDQLYDFQS